MDDEEVLKVLEEETGEVLRGSPIHTLSAQDSQHLYPGQDFKNGVLHYTFPLFDVREETQGKSKDAPTVPKRYVYTGCVTGEHELFMYDTVELHDRGFMRPDHFLDADTGWNGDEARAFASGKATIPDAYDLYLRVRGVYEKYIEFAEEILYDVMTTWVISTYMFRVFNTFSYLHFNGSAASGKSQNLRILTAIGFNAQWTAQLTAANIYRSITNNPGVLCIDEAESFDGDRGQALRDVLRNGYMAGSHVKRQRSKASGDMVEDRFEVVGSATGCAPEMPSGLMADLDSVRGCLGDVQQRAAAAGKVEGRRVVASVGGAHVRSVRARGKLQLRRPVPLREPGRPGRQRR